LWIQKKWYRNKKTNFDYAEKVRDKKNGDSVEEATAAGEKDQQRGGLQAIVKKKKKGTASRKKGRVIPSSFSVKKGGNLD